ncbi:MAG: hypothetical protein BMS9Abin23_0703 [Thermodesulfobacteriota bacterium]|nr:MAG: hypothetical protein BMS9Abin23_0703 [Thermodesulfobacteriota bacterium]
MENHEYNLDKGYTLIELVIAIAILAVGLISTATLVSTGIGSNRFAYRLTVESSLAYSVLDEFLAKDTSDTLFDTNATNAVYDLDTGSTATTRTVQGVTYSAIYSIVTNTPITGAVTISVTVTGGGRTATLSTVKRAI